MDESLRPPGQKNMSGKLISYRCKVLSFTFACSAAILDEVIDISTADEPLLHLALGEIAEQLRAGMPE